MIKIAPNIKNKKKIQEPTYKIVFDYMIGDANGYTSEENEVQLDNPHVEQFITILGKLKSIHGHWGVMLSKDRIKKSYEQGQITQEEFQFIEKLYEYEDDYCEELLMGVRSETENSFLVFQGVDLFYIDEFGEQFNTYFE